MTQRITVPFLNDMLKISVRNLRSNQNLKHLFPKIKFQEKRKIFIDLREKCHEYA